MLFRISFNWFSTLMAFFITRSSSLSRFWLLLVVLPMSFFVLLLAQMSSVIINVSLVFAVYVDWSFVLLAMEELLSMLITELLVITFSDFFSAGLLSGKNYFVISLLLLRKMLNNLSMVFCLFSSSLLRNKISSRQKLSLAK